MSRNPAIGRYGEPGYTQLQVPGLPGVRLRVAELDLHTGAPALRVLCALAADVLAAGGATVPCWPVAWPAGRALARYLARKALQGLRVLEVGCGAGVAGLGALAAGARLTATDLEPAAIRLAQMNAHRNGFQAAAFAADWRSWPVLGSYPLVFGADVTYEPALAEDLIAALEASVACEGRVLLAEPSRRTTAAFRRVAEARGWRWETERLPSPASPAVLLHRLTPPPGRRTR